MTISKSGTFPRSFSVVVMVEDPGAYNLLAPLIDKLASAGIPTILFGVGVGARMLRERGYAVVKPPVAAEVKKFLVSMQSAVLVIGTSEDPLTPAFSFIDAAKAIGMPSVAVVDVSVNAAFRFRGVSDNPLSHAPDWLIVSDKATAEAFISMGFPRGRIDLIINPAREDATKRGRILRWERYVSLARTDQPRIVFISERSDGLNPTQYRFSDSYTLIGRGFSTERTLIVAEELLDSIPPLRENFGWHPKLTIRLHPKESVQTFGPLLSEFDEVRQGGDPLLAIADADLVIGMTSTLLAQAMDMGIPCLALLPRAEETDWLIEIRTGQIPAVTRRDMISPTINHLLSSSSSTRSEGRPHKPGSNSADQILDRICSFFK